MHLFPPLVLGIRGLFSLGMHHSRPCDVCWDSLIPRPWTTLFFFACLETYKVSDLQVDTLIFFVPLLLTYFFILGGRFPQFLSALLN